MEELEGTAPPSSEPKPGSWQQPRTPASPRSPSSPGRPPLPPHSPTQPRSPHGPSPLSPNAASRPPLSPRSPRHEQDNLRTRLPAPPSSAAVAAAQARGTYVVQVARDQIYRVPPPENALLVERYLGPQQDGQKRCGGPSRKCMLWTCSIFFMLVIVVAIICLIIFAVARPKEPIFSVEKLSIKGKTMQSAKEFDVRLSVSNPSGQTDYSFLKGGSAVLSHRGSNIATGKPPPLSQKHEAEATTVNIMLKASSLSKKRLPIGKGVPVTLSIWYPISARIAGMQAWQKEAAVDCDIQLGISATRITTVLSQECSVKLQ